MGPMASALIPAGHGRCSRLKVTIRPMPKRLFVALVWGYTCWYGSNIAAAFLGLPEIVGPIVGLIAAGVVALDPGHVIWGSDPTPSAEPTAEA